MALTLGGFGFSAYLTYREAFTLHTICEWCVTSAVIMTVLMCLSIWRFLRGGRTEAQARARRARGEAGEAPSSFVQSAPNASTIKPSPIWKKTPPIRFR